MKVVTDSDLKLLLIEALDYNTQVISLCTQVFGKIDNQRNAKKFEERLELLTENTIKERKMILGMSDE